MNKKNISDMLSYYKHINLLISRTNSKVLNIALGSCQNEDSIFHIATRIANQTNKKRKLLRQKEFIGIVLNDVCGNDMKYIEMAVLNEKTHVEVSDVLNISLPNLKRKIENFYYRIYQYLKSFSDKWYEEIFLLGKF